MWTITSLIGLVLGIILWKVNNIMATVKDISDKLDSVAAGVDGLEAEIKALKAQVAAGGAVSEADLDGLLAKVDAIGTDISDTSDQ